MILNYVEKLDATGNFAIIWNYIKTLRTWLVYIRMGYAVRIWNYVGNSRACKPTYKSACSVLEFAHICNN